MSLEFVYVFPNFDGQGNYTLNMTNKSDNRPPRNYTIQLVEAPVHAVHQVSQSPKGDGYPTTKTVIPIFFLSIPNCILIISPYYNNKFRIFNLKSFRISMVCD